MKLGRGSLGTHVEEFFAEGHEAVAVVCCGGAHAEDACDEGERELARCLARANFKNWGRLELVLTKTMVMTVNNMIDRPCFNASSEAS